MAKRIIKKIGGDRIGSGGKMTVAAHGYGYSTHDVGKVRRTSMSFGTLVPMGQWLLTSGSRLSIKMDALITSNALLYQLYGTAKFQLDVYSARMALYNPKMLLNLNDQGYQIGDIKFPQMELTTKGITTIENPSNQQINPSALLRYLGVSANGQREAGVAGDVTRKHMAMWLLMYYQIVKEYYANRQEKQGLMIHNDRNGTGIEIKNFRFVYVGGYTTEVPQGNTEWTQAIPNGLKIEVIWKSTVGGVNLAPEAVKMWRESNLVPVSEWATGPVITPEAEGYTKYTFTVTAGSNSIYINGYDITQIAPDAVAQPRLAKYDLKEIDKMMMYLMTQVESTNPVTIGKDNAFPYGASFRNYYDFKSINGTQEGLCLGTYQSDVFNNWLDNATINTLNNKNKIKVNEQGEFSIDMLNLTQKLYNYDQRVGITDGTLEEWRELTYAQVGKGKSLKPVYHGGLSKEIVFDQIVSTASTDQDPLGTIASRGQFGSKHKGGYARIEADEEMLVMVIAKITPRVVYNQGNDWTTNLKTLEDLHKPALDKIGYQNLITDQMAAFETQVKADGTLITQSAGKQPAWQWYRTNYDDALGNMAETEDYKVFGRSYEATKVNNIWRIKDLTTYIDPMKYNDVFAIQSLDAMNFDVQVGMDAKLTMVMSEEVIPNL